MELEVRPMLTFVHADWGLFPSAINMEGVMVLWPKEVARVVSRPGPLSPKTVRTVAEHLARELKAA